MNSRVLHAVQLQLQLLLTLGSVADASATSFVALRLPSFISSDMVLQRGYVMLTNSDGPHAPPAGFFSLYALGSVSAPPLQLQLTSL